MAPLSTDLSSNFTQASVLSAVSGGAVLALATMAKLKMNGNILGISGIAGGIVRPAGNEGKMWRLLFTGGLAGAGIILGAFRPESLQALPSSTSSLVRLSAAGLLVGVGTSLGNGCTSGHGISGLTRFSLRSLAATCTFMCTGAITATLLSTGLWTESGAALTAPASDGQSFATQVSGAFLAFLTLVSLLPLPQRAARSAVEIASGLVFGLALGVSGMAKPSNVAHFLDFSSGLAGWDPTLMFVMGGALCCTVPLYHLWVKHSKPAFAEKHAIPSNTRIDARLILGAGLFGCGWGVAGICPGPLLVSVGASATQPGAELLPSATFLATMAAGWWVVPALTARAGSTAGAAPKSD